MALLDQVIQKMRFRQVLNHVEPIENLYGRALRVVDVGAGRGEFSRLLQARGHQVLGLDTHNCNLEQGLPCADRAYDLAVCIAVVEHLHQWKKLLAELQRVADHVVLTTPSPYGRPVLNFLAFLRLANPAHIADHKHYLSQSDLVAAGYCHKYFQLGLNQVAACSREESFSYEVGPPQTLSCKTSR